MAPPRRGDELLELRRLARALARGEEGGVPQEGGGSDGGALVFAIGSSSRRRRRRAGRGDGRERERR
jgi:hypothetical protein